jgi:hypothetical protein
MREFVALGGRLLLEATRSPGLRYLGLGFLALLPLAFLLPVGDRPEGTTLLVLSTVVAFLAFGLAASAGSLLPEERESGREEWLATLAPGGAIRRVVATLAAAAGVAVAVLAAGLLVAGASALAGRPSDLRAAREIPVPGAGRLGAPRPGDNPSVALTGSPAAGPVLLEVEARALALSREAARTATTEDLAGVRLGFRSDGTEGEAVAPRRAPLRIELPAGARGVELENRTPGTALHLRTVRLLAEPEAPAASFLWASLVLALCAGALVPSAVAISRVTSASTAVGAAMVLALLGVVRPAIEGATPPPVIEDSHAHDEGHDHAGHDHHDPGPGDISPALERGGFALLLAATRVAPDYAGLSPVTDPIEGRAVGVEALGGALPPILHGALALLLVALPAPRRRRR